MPTTPKKPGQQQYKRHIEQSLPDQRQKQPVFGIADGLECDSHHIAQTKGRKQGHLGNEQLGAVVDDDGF